MAISDEINYSNSELSTAVTVTITEPTTPIQLEAPVLSYNVQSNTLSWTQVENAIAYEIYRDGSYVVQVSPVTFTYTPIKGGSFTVVAVGDDIAYTNSVASNSVDVDFTTDIKFASDSDAGVAITNDSFSLKVIVVLILTVLKSPV